MTVTTLLYATAATPPEGLVRGVTGATLLMQARVAALRLGFTTAVLEALDGATTEQVETARAALILQINHQVAHGQGTGERVVKSETRGSRSVSYADGAPLLDFGAKALVDELLPAFVDMSWSAITSVRPIVSTATVGRSGCS